MRVTRKAGIGKVVAIAGVLAALSAAASAQEVLAPPAGTEFVMSCSGGQSSTWVFAENANGTVKVHQVGKPELNKTAPVWAYMLADIYDTFGTGRGNIRMKRVKGAEAGITKLVVGERHRFTYHWVGLRGEADRNHTIHVRSMRRVPTGAFGEQEVYEVVDTSSSPFHDLRREVLYSPALKMFVSFKVTDNRTAFQQSCELASLKAP